MSAPNKEFENLLVAILHTNNEIRNQAEAAFNNLKKEQPDNCIGALISVLRHSTQEELRSLAIVLLRKCISSEDSIFPKLTDASKQAVKSELLGALQEEKVGHIRSKLVYTVSNFVAGLLEENSFPEFIPTMFNWAKNPSPVLRENALGIFNHLSSVMLAGPNVDSYLVGFKDVLAANLQDDKNPIVRLAALEATCSVILSLEKKHFAAFQELIGFMMQTIAQLLNNKDEEGASAAIENFIEIAVNKASFLQKQINPVISAMFQIAKTTDLDDAIRHLAVEFIISTTESIPKTIQKIPSFVDSLFPFCMTLMLDLEHDDEEWSNTFVEDELDLTNYDVGLESLDRMSLALGGELVQPVAFKYIPQFLSNAEWKHRHTGLMAISQTAEGCYEQYENHLDQIVQMVANLFNDPHPRVRYAAIHCSAQLSTDFQGIMQEKYHQLIVPSLLKGMDDPLPKVKAHAATAIVNFVEECDNQFIEPYMNQMLFRLLGLLKSGHRYCQEQSLSAISAVADCAEKLFMQYYHDFVPLLKQILLQANGKDDKQLKARAIECVSLIGVAVGKDVFGKDAREIMELLMRTQQQGFENDDPQQYQILQAYARIAKCLGADFVPYLAFIMPYLLNAAGVEPEVLYTDVDEDDEGEQEGMESITFNLKGLGGKRISIRTSTLEEKSLACHLLHSYVSDLKELFLPYIDSVYKVMIPLLQFAYMEDVRENAAAILPQLLVAVKAAIEKKMCDPNQLRALFDSTMTNLLEALKEEGEVHTSLVMIESLTDCVKIMGDNSLTEAQISSIIDIYKISVLSSIERRQEVIKVMQTEEDEEEQARLDDDALEEERFLTITAESIGQLMKTNEKFIPYFINNLWPVFNNMLGNDFGDDDHRVALCIVCDFIENGGNLSHQFFDRMIPALLTYAVHNNPEVRQAAVYGIGACAQYAGEPFAQVVQKAVEVLGSVILRADARKRDAKPATANAVSALFKFIQYRSSHPYISAHITQIAQTWLNALPVGGDMIEAKIVHSHLAAQVQQNNPAILGQNNANVPKVLQVFADIVNTQAVGPETQSIIVQLLKQMSQQPQFFQQVTSTLTNEQKQKLQSIMQ